MSRALQLTHHVPPWARKGELTRVVLVLGARRVKQPLRKTMDLQRKVIVERKDMCESGKGTREQEWIEILGSQPSEKQTTFDNDNSMIIIRTEGFFKTGGPGSRLRI